MVTDLTALWLLFSSSFLSATLLPGSSEIVLITLIKQQSYSTMQLLLIATIGNSLGGFSNYLIGRFLLSKTKKNTNKHNKSWLSPPWKTELSTAMKARGRRYGSFILLLSWLPIIGDPLCLLAGYLRFNWLLSLTIITIAKFSRYYFLVFIVSNY